MRGKNICEVAAPQSNPTKPPEDPADSHVEKVGGRSAEKSRIGGKTEKKREGKLAQKQIYRVKRRKKTGHGGRSDVEQVTVQSFQERQTEKPNTKIGQPREIPT